MKSLEEIATYIVSDGKGILAADESTPTIGKRFATINAESTEDSRRDYREMLFRADGMKNNIGGVILFDETIRQKTSEGITVPELIKKNGAGYLKPFIALSSNAFIVWLNAFSLSLNAFVTLGFGSIPIKGVGKYICIVQGFMGWFLLSIFTVTLINQVLI